VSTASSWISKYIYKYLNDISFLSKSRYGRSLSRDEAVIWRTSISAFAAPQERSLSVTSHQA
jgi:hypothetical protein